MLETIKSYLVGLGFNVDKASYDQTTKAISSVEAGLTSFASAAVKTFGAAATAVAAFGVAAATTSAKFLGGLGDQEIQMEELSRQLWTTQQQAMAFNATLKAMGANLQDLYLSPTLMAQYNQLHSVALQMQTPSDYDQQIKMIQDVSLQLKQMQLEAYYALQWIGYYFIKYMQGPISNVQNVLQDINDVIVKNMPSWTLKVAEVMASFMQAGVYIVQAMENVYNWLAKLLAYVPGWAKAIGAALLVLSVSNPFMLFVEGLSAAILLLDDFETYVHGGKAAFPQLWAQVEKVNAALKQMGVEKDVANDIKTAFQTLGNVFQDTVQFIQHLYSVFKDNGTLTDFKNSITSVGYATDNLVKSVGNLITSIGNLFGKINNSSNQSGLVNFFQLIANLANTAIQEISGAIDALSFLANAVSDVLSGNWKAAADFINLIDGAGGTIPSSLVSGATGNTAGAMGPPVGPSSYPYMFQQSGTTSVKNVTVNASQTNNIQGSNAQSIANANSASYNRMMHNLSGVIG